MAITNFQRRIARRSTFDRKITLLKNNDTYSSGDPVESRSQVTLWAGVEPIARAEQEEDGILQGIQTRLNVWIRYTAYVANSITHEDIIKWGEAEYRIVGIEEHGRRELMRLICDRDD